MKDMDELKTAWKGVSRYFVFSALICYAMCLDFGFYGWILYSPEVLMYFFFNVTEPDQLPDPSTQLFFLELAIDLFPLGALIGSLLSGYMADRFGRKMSLAVTNILSIISVIFLGCNTLVYIYEFTICAHLLTGICIGVNFCLIYLYLFEIAPRTIRGVVIMLTNFFVKVGNMVAQILSFPSIIGYQKGWYLLVFLAAIIPLTLIFLLPKIPESPRYLLIQREDEEAARNVLQKLKVSGDVEEEIEELQQEDRSEKEEKKTDIIHLGKISSLSSSLFSMIVLMIGSQFIGFHELYYYNYDILRKTEMTYNTMWIVKTAISFFLCLITLVAAYFIEYWGRRILFLSGLAICTVCIILLVVVLELLRYQVTSVLSYLCVTVLVMFLAAFTIGPNIISVVLSLELFLQSTRASAFAISGSVFCIVTILLTLMEGKTKRELGPYSLLLYSPFCVALFIYFYMYIPETKNLTLVDIRKMMATQKSRKIHVKKDKARKESGEII